ncbi:hypothetical protein D3H65_25770 [Paraflavitalea soli]|uniref:Uncharacterized protein n=1 Tax=Paraflavitalea soli TaxID=2315862 RepID=A0A3B7N502_9BACT|nr:hypothetical protein [Paraflavitalea soli]AXY77181.1 hypothetical protein D3H65_25770 [Paraflavitalea soli]
MARNISTVFKFKGTLGNVTYVDSATYGPHTRMERGTYTPISLNKTMKQCKDRLMNCNKQAKAIFDALKDEPRDGSLWWRLLSIFFKRAKEGLKPHVGMLAGLECDAKNPLGEKLGVPYKIAVERGGKTMNITISFDRAPRKNDVKQMTHYQLQLVVLYPSFSKNHVRKEIAAGPMTLFSAEPGEVMMEVAAPSAAAPYVLLLGVRGYSYVAQKYYEVASYRGMAVVG